VFSGFPQSKQPIAWFVALASMQIASQPERDLVAPHYQPSLYLGNNILLALVVLRIPSRTPSGNE
jgi:hypothetical protein